VLFSDLSDFEIILTNLRYIIKLVTEFAQLSIIISILKLHWTDGLRLMVRGEGREHSSKAASPSCLAPSR
jgi:hypothetical protein